MKTKAGIEKPLAEWTLGEVKKFCCSMPESMLCKDCSLYVLCGSNDVSGWDLSEKSEKPKFTEQEIQDSKSIMRIFDTDNIVAGRDSMGSMTILVHRSNVGGKGYFINKDLFPSTGAGKTFHLSEIAGDSDA